LHGDQLLIDAISNCILVAAIVDLDQFIPDFIKQMRNFDNKNIYLIDHIQEKIPGKQETEKSDQLVFARDDIQKRTD
jgi:hypothetical protein